MSLLTSVLLAFMALLLFRFVQPDVRESGEPKKRWLSGFGISAAYRLVSYHDE